MELEESTCLTSGSTTKPLSLRQYGTGTRTDIYVCLLLLWPAPAVGNQLPRCELPYGNPPWEWPLANSWWAVLGTCSKTLSNWILRTVCEVSELTSGSVPIWALRWGWRPTLWKAQIQRTSQTTSGFITNRDFEIINIKLYFVDVFIILLYFLQGILLTILWF